MNQLSEDVKLQLKSNKNISVLKAKKELMVILIEKLVEYLKKVDSQNSA